MHDLAEKKDALIAAAKRCFDLRLQTNAGGNLSVRLDSADAIVIKPSGIGFNECTRDNLQIVHLDGTIEESPHKPSKISAFTLAFTVSAPISAQWFTVTRPGQRAMPAPGWKSPA